MILLLLSPTLLPFAVDENEDPPSGATTTPESIICSEQVLCADENITVVVEGPTIRYTTIKLQCSALHGSES